MNYRILGKTGLKISEISLGTWQVGGKWGDKFSFENAETILSKAVDSGINFIDTADVYGDGDKESERSVGQFIRKHSGQIYIATKCGRQLDPHINEAYTPQVLRKFVEDSLKNTGLERLDLIQLHCPPTEVYYRPEIFELFDKLKAEGKIAHMGVSVEKVEEALKAIEYENVTTVQIIFNMFRQRPANLFFEQAKKRNVGILARVPLASGLLTGKFTRQTAFSSGDHRNFNRDGAAFDRGETFSGIDYETGLDAIEEIKRIFPDKDLTTLALKWILQFDAVSCVIPGASKVEQVESNLKAIQSPDLTEAEMEHIQHVYNERIKPLVHHYW